mgnify:CR=1 FL=1
MPGSGNLKDVEPRKIGAYWGLLSSFGWRVVYQTITLDMKGQGETCGKNRIYRIMKEAGIRSQRGYRKHRG